MTIKATTTADALYIVVKGADSLKHFQQLCDRAGNCWWESAPDEIKELLDVVKPPPSAPVLVSDPSSFMPGGVLPRADSLYMRQRKRMEDGAMVEFVSWFGNGEWHTRSGLPSAYQRLLWRSLTEDELAAVKRGNL